LIDCAEVWILRLTNQNSTVTNYCTNKNNPTLLAYLTDTLKRAHKANIAATSVERRALEAQNTLGDLGAGNTIVK
jgi:hypothetical protein